MKALRLIQTFPLGHVREPRLRYYMYWIRFVPFTSAYSFCSVSGAFGPLNETLVRRIGELCSWLAWRLVFSGLPTFGQFRG